MGPLARNLVACLDALKEGDEPAGTTSHHSHEDGPDSPRLAYDHACLHMFVARRRDLTEEERRRQRGYAIEDLRSALLAEPDKVGAKEDPCFAELRTDPRFQELVRLPTAAETTTGTGTPANTDTPTNP
ncbi:hypothetical protein ACIGO8_06810 [Streptomyces sp. NPDC053493]|uniref:hypothetical protein n=1 Tax=Streptomyces sp. NPDC053493 TaxID=3365705 RepID=UPI0037CD7FE2